MSTTTARRARAPFLFSARAGLGADGALIARSFSRELPGVFTRAYPKLVMGQTGRFGTVARGVPAFSVVDGDLALLLEPETTNLVIQSDDFTSTEYSTANLTRTANVALAPDQTSSTATADRCTATATAATLLGEDASIAGTAATMSVYVLVAPGSHTALAYGIANLTTSTDLVFITFNAQTAAWSYTTGSTGARVTRLGSSDWYRIDVTATSGITSTNTVRAYYGFSGGSYPAGATVVQWRAQLTASRYPTSPILTAGASLTRSADALYFPFHVPPQPLTAYVRFRELGTANGTNEGVLSLGSGDTASVFLLTGGAGSYYGVHRRAADEATASVLPTVAPGDLVELSVQLLADGSLSLTQRLNGGAVSGPSLSAANAYASTFDVPRLYLGSRGALPGAYGITDAAVDFGARSLVEMASLCEVG